MATNGYDAYPVRLTCLVVIPAMTQVAGPVRTDARALIHTEPEHSVQCRHELKVANGVHDALSKDPFHILVANFTKKARELPKGTVVAYAKRNPLALLVPDADVVRSVGKVLHIDEALSAAEASAQENRDSRLDKLSTEENQNSSSSETE